MDRIYWDTRDYKGELPDEVVYDVRVLYEWGDDLVSLVRKVEPEGIGEFLDLDRRCTAHLTAAKEGQVEGAKTRDLIPNDLFQSYARARQEMTSTLFSMKPDSEKERYAKTTYPLLRDVRHIERNLIHVDVPFAAQQLKSGKLAIHEQQFMKNILQHAGVYDGLIATKITPVGTRTGRLGVESGFPAMTVPHGVCRQAVTSRFDGGEIVTLDFNAIDYRCIVNSLGNNSLKEWYRGERDFHARTASIVDAARDITKKVTYTHLYGGTKRTLQKQTLLSEAEIDRMLAKLDAFFQSISSAREKMAKKARECGYVFTPSGEFVKVEKDDHDGKILGLYAQRYSSEIFNKAIALAVRGTKLTKSKVIFTVHDEIVMDVSADESVVPENLKATIENETGFVVKLKRGKNYGEATD